MVRGIYAGSFDPVTFGHLDIIVRASRVVEELAAERRRWEAEHGPLPPVEMDVTPPVL